MYNIIISSKNETSVDIELSGKFSGLDCASAVIALSNLFANDLGITYQEFKCLLNDVESHSINFMVNMTDIDKKGENGNV